MGGTDRKLQCKKWERSGYLFPCLPLSTDWCRHRLYFSIKVCSSWWTVLSIASAFTKFQEQLSHFAPLVQESISLLLVPGASSALLVALNPVYLFAHNHFGKLLWTAMFEWVICPLLSHWLMQDRFVTFVWVLRRKGWVQRDWVTVMELDRTHTLRTDFVELHREFVGGNNWWGIFLFCA